MQHGGNVGAAILCSEVGVTHCEWQINKAEIAWDSDDDGAAAPAQTVK